MAAKPLSDFPCGAKVCIDSYNAGQSARCRLCALGLTPGTTVTVDAAGGAGPCRLRVRGADLVLGHGLACLILAKPVG